MALLEKHLEVKRSTIPGAGKGLFTKKEITKGTHIVEYKGKVTTWKDADHRDGKNGYIYYVKRNHVIDASNNEKALARYANDARGLQKVKGIQNNAEYIEDGIRTFIVASKTIVAGSEILVGYGKEYWDAIRYNIKLDEKEAQKALGAKAMNGTKAKPSKKKKAKKK
ncbi:MAG: SET domain-containing protein [Chitinophagaceae bacterium]